MDDAFSTHQTWSSIVQYFLVVAPEEVPVPLSSNQYESMVDQDLPLDPISDVVIVEKREECPEDYSVVGSIICNKCKEINQLKSTHSMTDITANPTEIDPEYFICVSRRLDKQPITQLVYATVTEGDAFPNLIGVEKVPSPIINLTPTWEKMTGFELYARREHTRLPIVDLIVINKHTTTANLEEAPLTAQTRVASTGSGVRKSPTSLSLTKPDDLPRQPYKSVPPNFVKVENVNFSKMVVNMYVRTVEEFPRVDVAYRGCVTDRLPIKDVPSCSFPPGVENFCLPDGVWFHREQPRSDFFTFVLTDAEGALLYGACYTLYEQMSFTRQRITRTLYSPKSLCILSRWPFFCGFKAYFQALSSLLKSPCPFPMESLISNLLEVPLPPQGTVTVNLNVGRDRQVSFSRPSPLDFPLADYSLLPLFHALDLPNIATLLCLIVTESKILIQARYYALLTPIAEALTSLLFPLRWQHIYIPLCPSNLLDFLQAPVPFIIGVRTGTVDFSALPTDVYLVDIDNNRIQKKKDPNGASVPPLPAQAQFLERLTAVASHLFIKGYTSMDQVDLHPYKEAASINGLKKTPEQVRMDAVRELFLDFFVSVLRPYGHFLTIPTADTIHEYSAYYEENPAAVFDKKAFLAATPMQDHRFMETLLASQAFSRFLEQRSFMSNCGEEILFFDMCIDKAQEIEMDIRKSMEAEVSSTYPSSGDLLTQLGLSNLSHSHLELLEGPKGQKRQSSGSSIGQRLLASTAHAGQKRQSSGSSIGQRLLSPTVSIKGFVGGHLSQISPVASVRKPASYKRTVSVPEPQMPDVNRLKRIYGDLSEDGTTSQEIAPFDYKNHFPSLNPDLFLEPRHPAINFRTSYFSNPLSKQFSKESQDMARKFSEMHDTRDSKVVEPGTRVKAEQFYLAIHHVWLYIYSAFISDASDISEAFDFAFQVLHRMKQSNIGPGEKSYRFLLAACARLGLGNQARKVFQLMSDDGILPNAITTGLFVKAILKEQNRAHATDGGVRKVSGGIDPNLTVSIRTEIPKSPISQRASTNNPLLGDPLLLGRIRVESKNVCPWCEYKMREEDILIGWTLIAQSTSTHCPKCKRPFVPVLSHAPFEWNEETEGNNPSIINDDDEGDINTPSTCPYLSPPVLYREVDIALFQSGLDANASPTFRMELLKEHPILFWNLVWYFTKLSLPYDYSYLRSTPHVVNDDTLQFTNEEAMSYTAQEAQLRVHVRVNGLRGRLIGRPMCVAHTHAQVVSPQKFTTNSKGKDVLQSIANINLYVNTRRLKAAMDLFLECRIKYPNTENDLMSWFHTSMYIALLSIATVSAYPLEEHYAQSYKESIKSIKQDYKSMLLWDDSDQSDMVPTEAIIAVRSVFRNYRPTWRLHSTRFIRDQLFL